MIKKYLPWILLASFIVIQFFQIDRTNVTYDKTKDFLTNTSAPDDMQKMISNSCYDCHSNEVTYPWYTYINPVGWWVKGHVNEGTGKLNFSTWADYPINKRQVKLEECAEKTEATEMPLLPYIIAHSKARLSDEDRAKLVAWFKTQAAN